MKSRIFLTTLALAATFSAFAQNSGLVLRPGNEREILSQMTLEEKAALVVGGDKSAFLGYGNAQNLVPGSAGNTVSIPRLGITTTILADGPAGLRISPRRNGTDKTFFCTGFPVGIAIASSWDQDLVYEVGSAIGSEVRDYGVDVLLAPGQNLMRDPLCGRNFEYFSEDPLLSGKMASAYVRGVQSNGVGTSVKHFAVNNQETNRKDLDARISERALRELYLRGFEIAVREAKPWTVMSAYNMINGQQCMESRDLLTTILRDEWGFEGIVMCDWASPGWRDSAKEIWAGNDLLTPGSNIQYQEVVDAVNSGRLDVKDLDECVYRLLRYITWTPRYKGLPYSENPPLEKNAKTARQIAGECQVLLKNDSSTLPLSNDKKKVALFGISSYDFIAGGTGSGNVNKAYVVNLLDGLENAGFEVDEAIGKMYMEKRDALLSAYASSSVLGRGSLQDFLPDDEYIDGGAERNDLAIITIGRNCGEGADRHVWNDFNLTSVESSLIRLVCAAFHAQGKKVIVILNVSGIVETATWKDIPDAILLSWLPGQEGGNSVADVLTGKVNPSGRLPMTMPVEYFDSPTYDNFPYDYTGPLAMGNYPKIPRPERKNVHYVNYDEGLYVGYRYYDNFDKRVSFPFGFGLSYTTFSFGKPSVRKEDGVYHLTIEIENTGHVAGKEVVQAYYSISSDKVDRPLRQLVSFAKTPLLSPGEKTTMTLSFTERDLSYFDEERHEWILEKGRYEIEVGENSRNILGRMSLDETSSKTLEKVHGVLLKQPVK